MDAQTTVTVRCTACGKLGEVRPSCGCGANFEYVSPTQQMERRREEAIELYKQGLTQEQIATKLGVSQQTISLDLEGLPIVGKPPRPKGGRPKGKGEGKKHRKRKNDPKQEAAAASAVLNGESTLKQAADAVGLGSVQGVKTGVAYELGKRDAYSEVGALGDFSKMTAKQQRDVAIRAQKKLLERDYEQRVVTEVQRRFDKAFPTLQQEKNAAYQRERDYREYLKKAPKAMTVAEFNLVCSLLHPDSRASASNERLLRAFQMFKPKKFAITAER